MVGKFLSFVGGLAGAAAASQAPGYTLQYMQNLNGRLAELETVVERFDSSIEARGYSREAALDECKSATGLLDSLCDGINADVARYEYLLAHKLELDAATPYLQPLTLAQSYDKTIAADVMEAFEPAIPVTVESGAYAGGGFVVIWGALSLIWGLIKAPFSGRREDRLASSRWG